MMTHKLFKRIFVLLAVLSLLLAVVPAMSFAQEETTEEDQTEEVAAEEGAEEAEHAGEEEGGLLTPLGINGGLLIAQVVNFLLIAGLLSFFIWRPAVNMLDARSAKIQKGIEDAAAAARARQNAEAEAEKVLAEARTERQKLVDEARSQAEELKKQLESEARQEAERIREDARQEAIAERNAELAGMREQVLAISTTLAGRVLEENIDEGKQKALVSDFFAKLPEGAKSLTGEVEVVTAMPLTDDEKSRLESEINAASYTYTVDPSILGGVIVRSQDKVVDGSVRSNLTNLTGRVR
jgi:F-type H+-transporting ATPase subunit b